MNSLLRYRHGGSAGLDLDRFNLPERPLLDFSVNLNSLGIPGIVRERWKGLLDTLDIYPSVDGDGIVCYYRKKFGIPDQDILAGNGSTEMIYLVPRALRLKRVLVITPSYHDYERASILAGAEVARLPLTAEDGFALPGADQLAEAVRDCDALWIGRPNNPTGTLMHREHILGLARRFPDQLFIVDESFIQFTENWAEESLLTEQMRPNILVIHSLTKFYALPGLRMGGLIGDRDLVSRLRQVKEPWSVNGIADKIAPLLLECTDYEDRTRSLTSKERRRIYQHLDTMDEITQCPSCTNFILLQWNRTRDLDDLMRHLLANGAYVRDCRNFPGLERNFFRIGLKAPYENDRLISLLASPSAGLPEKNA